MKEIQCGNRASEFFKPGQIIERTRPVLHYSYEVRQGARARVDQVFDYDYPLLVTYIGADAGLGRHREHWTGWAIIEEPEP